MRFFKRLMPKEDRFFGLFEAHAVEVSAGARALAEALGGAGEPALQAVMDHEEAADAVTKEVLLAVRRSFITPFDRGAIKDLVTAMDDSIDQMNKTARTIRLFGVSAFDSDMRGMAGHIVEASAIVERALPLLRAVGANASEIIGLCERVIAIEGEADTIHRHGIKALWDGRNDQHRPADVDHLTVHDVHQLTRPPMAGLEGFLVGERVLDSLEKVMDRLEDVADVLHGLVIEHV